MPAPRNRIQRRWLTAPAITPITSSMPDSNVKKLPIPSRFPEAINGLHDRLSHTGHDVKLSTAQRGHLHRLQAKVNTSPTPTHSHFASDLDRQFRRPGYMIRLSGRERPCTRHSRDVLALGQLVLSGAIVSRRRTTQSMLMRSIPGIDQASSYCGQHQPTGRISFASRGSGVQIPQLHPGRRPVPSRDRPF